MKLSRSCITYYKKCVHTPVHCTTCAHTHNMCTTCTHCTLRTAHCAQLSALHTAKCTQHIESAKFPFWQKSNSRSSLGDGHIDTQVTILAEHMRHACLEDQTVIVLNGSRYALVDASWCCFPQHSTAVSIEFQSVKELFRLLSCTYQLNNGKELLVGFVLFLKHNDGLIGRYF